MTTKAKLFSVSLAAICILLATLWVLQGLPEDGVIVDPTREPSGRTLVADGRLADDKTGTVAGAEKAKRTEVSPQPTAAPTLARW